MNEEVWRHPETVFSIDEIGDTHIQWMFDHYAGARTRGMLPLFNRAYDILTERKNFSRRRAFGEMHGDCYMWVEKCEHSKVIVYQTQSNLYIYILEGYRFHIRELLCPYSYPEYKKSMLKESRLINYRNTDFVCSYDMRGNPGLQYGDSRDKGYLGTAILLLKELTKVDNATSTYLAVLDMMNFWTIYLNDPEELE